MKNKKILIIVGVVVILTGIIIFSLKDKLYYSSLVNSESFKNSDAKTKYDLLENKDFRDSCSEEIVAKVVDSLTDTILAGNDPYDKVDLFSNPDFMHFSTDEKRNQLIKSILDTPNIPDDLLIKFLFKDCRTTDYKLVVEHIKSKKIVLSAKVNETVKSNIRLMSNDSDKELWQGIVQSNTTDLKQSIESRFDDLIAGSDLNKKIEFIRTADYAKYLSKEQKEKLIDSILDDKLDEEKTVYILFDVCSPEDFELFGERILKNRYLIETNTIKKIRAKMELYAYKSKVWSEIIIKDRAVKEQKVNALTKQVIEKNSLEEMIDLYATPEFLSYASGDTKEKLIDSMTNISNLTVELREKLIKFFFEKIDKDEFMFISNRIAKTGCNWDPRTIVDIRNKIYRNKYDIKVWDKIDEANKRRKNKQSNELIDNIKNAKTFEEKLMLFKNGNIRFSDNNAREEIIDSLTEGILTSKTCKEKFDFYSISNFKYASKETREKLIVSIVDSPDCDEGALRWYLPLFSESERKIAVYRLAENGFVLTNYLIATMETFDMFSNIDKYAIDKLFKNNPIAKRQIIIQAKERIQYNSYTKFLKIVDRFIDYLKIEKETQLYNDLRSLKELIEKKKPRYNEEPQLVNTALPDLKDKLMEHFNKVQLEYEEEIKNSSFAKDFKPETEKKKIKK